MVKNFNLTSIFYPFSPNYFLFPKRKVCCLQSMSSKKTIIHMNHGYLEMNNNDANN